MLTPWPVMSGFSTENAAGPRELKPASWSAVLVMRVAGKGTVEASAGFETVSA